MNDLRWILLALGVLFLLGLWWWETRRQRQAADHTSALRTPDPFASAMAPPSRPAARRLYEEPEEAPEASRELESFEDIEPLEPMGEAISPPQAEEGPYTIPLVIQRIEPSIGDAAAAVTLEPPTYMAPSTAEPAAEESDDVESTGTREMLLLDLDLPGPQDPPTQPLPVDDEPQFAAPPALARQEKIVTLRLTAPPLERFDGPALVRALEGAGLELGRFSIFHRHGPDGGEAFSVASLVEPGTFDLQAIEGRRFPGVSIFAVLREPGEASHIVEDMLATARRLANELQGSLQDERGAPLSSFRMTELRADVIAWQRSCSAAS